MLRSRGMTDSALTPAVAPDVRLPNVVAPPVDAPSMTELFAFMADAELRFETLRMRIVDRTWTARGEETEVSEVWLRHPSRAKVLTRVGSDAPRPLCSGHCKMCVHCPPCRRCWSVIRIS